MATGTGKMDVPRNTEQFAMNEDELIAYALMTGNAGKAYCPLCKRFVGEFNNCTITCEGDANTDWIVNATGVDYPECLKKNS